MKLLRGKASILLIQRQFHLNSLQFSLRLSQRSNGIVKLCLESWLRGKESQRLSPLTIDDGDMIHRVCARTRSAGFLVLSTVLCFSSRFARSAGSFCERSSLFSTSWLYSTESSAGQRQHS